MSANFTGGSLQNKLSTRRGGKGKTTALQQKKYFAERRLSKSLHNLTALQQQQQSDIFPASLEKEVKAKRKKEEKGEKQISFLWAGMPAEREASGEGSRGFWERENTPGPETKRSRADVSDRPSRKRERKSEVLRLLDTDPVLSFEQKRQKLLQLDDWAGLSAFTAASTSPHPSIQSGSIYGYGGKDVVSLPKLSPQRRSPTISKASELSYRHRNSVPPRLDLLSQQQHVSSPPPADPAFSEFQPEDPPSRSNSPTLLYSEPTCLYPQTRSSIVSQPSSRYSTSQPTDRPSPSPPPAHGQPPLRPRKLTLYEAPTPSYQSDLVRPLPARPSSKRNPSPRLAPPSPLPLSAATPSDSAASSSSTRAQQPIDRLDPLGIINSKCSPRGSGSIVSSMTSRSIPNPASSLPPTRDGPFKPQLFSAPSAFLSTSNAFLRPDLAAPPPSRRHPYSSPPHPTLLPSPPIPEPSPPQATSPSHLPPPFLPLRCPAYSPAHHQHRTSLAETPFGLNDFPISQGGARAKPATFRDRDNRYETHQLPSLGSSGWTHVTAGGGSTAEGEGVLRREGQKEEEGNWTSDGLGSVGSGSTRWSEVGTGSTPGRQTGPETRSSLAVPASRTNPVKGLTPRQSLTMSTSSRPFPHTRFSSFEPSPPLKAIKRNAKSTSSRKLSPSSSSSASASISISTRSRISATYHSQPLFPQPLFPTTTVDPSPSPLPPHPSQHLASSPLVDDLPLLPNPLYLTALACNIPFAPPPHIVPPSPPSPIFISHDALLSEQVSRFGGRPEGRGAGIWFWEKYGKRLASEGSEWLERRERERWEERERIREEGERDGRGGESGGGGMQQEEEKEEEEVEVRVDVSPAAVEHNEGRPAGWEEEGDVLRDVVGFEDFF